MQFFINTADQQIFAFEDDVEIIHANGVYAFKTSMGVPLDALPTTLQPCEPPVIETPDPSTVIPQQVTKRQGRLALLAAGKLAAVAEAIALMPSPQREAAEIEWNDATNYERSSPFMALLAEKIGLDEQALDALFIEAARL